MTANAGLAAGCGVFRIFARDDLAGSRIALEEHERIAQHALLQIAHERAAERVPDLETLRVKRSRRTHLTRGLWAHRDEHC